MISGHLGLALAARAFKREASLVWLVAASVAPDLVDGAFALVRACNPWQVYSHSLPAVAVLACVFGVGALLTTGSKPTAALAAGLVVSHLAVDFVTGEKLLWPHGP